MLGSGKDEKLRDLHPAPTSAALKSVPVKSIFAGVVLCGAAAVFLCLFMDQGRESRLAAPAMCLLVVIVTAIYLGRLAGIFGAATASCILAMFMYSPFGSLYVEEHAARMMLNLLLVGAVAVTLLVPRRPVSDRAAKSRIRRISSNKIAQFLKRDSGD